MSDSEKKISCNLTEKEASVLRNNLPVDEEIQDLAEFFKVFGDPTRIRILFLLKQGEFCVHDITTMLEMQQTAVSHQLKSLRQSRLVRYRKDGKQVFYSLNDEHIDEIIAIGLNHLNE
ncbi:MAG: metalloregulator ArsR/SmtB family transcription factor [Spirochaetales bacterium]|uniref:Metalloregulator ArsR/SmtB family transcription factor n=1 Tax=Candidatus Thalassospirochaeta sargassi TaxID=3119039 RepID=A0AAJ1IHQ0_9SPIO|nr:metalloregulator ArsR/SmtB family transcription factor [Spirochaetales bacterium]